MRRDAIPRARCFGATMRRVTRAPRLAPLVALLAACAGSGASAPRTAAEPAAATGRPPRDYFPLAVGNAWTFLDRSPQQPAPARRTVRIVQRDADGYFVDDAGNALRADADCLHDRARRLLCAPARPGQTWSSVVAPTVTERYEVVAAGERVTVPAGAFEGCVRVRSQVRAGGVEQVAELTYAPGVGPVKLETFAVVDGVSRPQVRGELESYRLSSR
jgi:hypothetical protein